MNILEKSALELNVFNSGEYFSKRTNYEPIRPIQKLLEIHYQIYPIETSPQTNGEGIRLGRQK